MKKYTSTLFILLLLFAGHAHASSLRFDNTLINEGKPASLLLIHLGEPLNKTTSDVCTSHNRQGDCREWRTNEIWFYRYNDLNYTIHISDGVIDKIEWSRF
ncbi:hypothetical protein ADINL_3136 [Nitrincola lacisaponensis]|uniref:Lipoprotein n=1 Tax=Nitrincola lacisaponensis TaxID=267850 RepID=A0A063Y1N0_9GAMM|nr:DUF2845 domain-containing protein [Nitrincola lacisaponensis]KDE38681.1 hypothetical protein ADINL_3136 [Nitrincola lacisaponensis]